MFDLLRRIANIDGFNDGDIIGVVYVFDLNDFAFLRQIAIGSLDKAAFTIQLIDGRLGNADGNPHRRGKAVVGRHIEFLYTAVLGIFDDVKAVAVDVAESILPDIVLGRDSIRRSSVNTAHIAHGAS